jgi:hypothetical protein
MNADRLASLATYGVSYDLETHKIQPGLIAPPPVCGSLAQLGENRQIAGVIVDKEGALDALIAILADERLVIVGQNIAFDFLVAAVYAARTRGLDLLPAIFEAYLSNRVYDIRIAEQLHAVARGHQRLDPRTMQDLRDPLTGEHKVGYRLSVLVDLVLNRTDAKVNDVWRESYALLEPFPIESWPLEAQRYPVDDACNTLEVALAQTGHLPSISAHEWEHNVCRRCHQRFDVVMEAHRGQCGVPLCHMTASRLNLHDLARQTFAAWALHLGGSWGFLVDPTSVEPLEATTLLVDPTTGELTDRGKHHQRFIEAGILRPDGSEDQAFLRRAVAIAYGCTGKHLPCDGTGKVVTKWAVRPVNCPHGADLKARGLGLADCTICPRRPLGTKQCVDCSATGLDIKSAPVPMTDASTKYPQGQVQTGRDALAETGDEILMDYASFEETAKIGDVYIPWLRKGIAPDGRPIPLTLRPNVLLETGRSSYGDVVQLLPRKGGVRECIVSRPGTLLSSVDYEGGELITHGQSCIWVVGESALADAIVKGIKPHNALAATILGISYDEFNRRLKAGDRQCKDVRQAAKPANFGFPGRMGALKLVQQQRKGGPDTPHPEGPTWIDDGEGNMVRGYKGLRFCLLMGRAERCGEPKVTEWKRRTISPTCRACIEAAQSLREGWLRQWPENGPYFEHVSQLEESGDPVVQHVTKRLRRPGPREGGAGNAIANGYFQALLADAAKDALCEVSMECYVRRRVPMPAPHEHAAVSKFAGEWSPLYGSRVILFAHDEDITEHPETVAPEGASRVGEIMVAKLQWYCPDLATAARAEPALMRRWWKNAEPKYDGSGRLVPWEPKAKTKKPALDSEKAAA